MNAIQQLLPHLNRWDDIERLARQILEFRIDGTNGPEPVVMFPWVAGGGFELGAVIGSLPGSSGTLLGSAVLNDQDWSHAKLSFQIDKSCTPQVGDGLAAANFLEIQRTKGPACNVKRIIGLGVTATIATTDPQAGKRGGQRVCVSIRRFDGTRRIVMRFKHSSEYAPEAGDQRDKRKLQSQLCDLAALNMVAFVLGLEQVPFLPEYEVTMEEGELVQSENGLIVKPYDVGVWEIDAGFDVLVIDTDGTVQPKSWLEPRKHVLIPSSANPFTPAHDEMALHLSGATSGGAEPVFLINTANAEKGGVSLEEVLRRARGFIGRWPVAIVRGMSQFVVMAEELGCDFAVGADTATRIFLPKYCEEFGGNLNVYARLKATGIAFTLFPRIDSHGRLRTIEDVPSMFRDLFVPAPDVISRFSSSAVRSACVG